VVVPTFGALGPLLREKGFPADFSKKMFPETSKRVPAKSYSTKNTNRIYQLASASTIPIPARWPVLGWETTLVLLYIDTGWS
jgi:hypothetical protein